MKKTFFFNPVKKGKVMRLKEGMVEWINNDMKNIPESDGQVDLKK